MKVVIALGGNALGKTPQEQLELVKKTAIPIVDLVGEGNEVILAHGNGPQVGMINKGMADENMPFPECGAMSQGYIGYHLQNAIKNELMDRGIDKNVVTVVTQVEVDKDDPGFEHPSKPIGAFMTKEQADTLAEEKGYTMVEDSGRGYRRVVPSPKPLDIVEKDVVNQLVAGDNIVITVGGGGIPVIKNSGYHGVPAVIDKDFASSKLAELVDADALCILTAVEHVAVNFGQPNQKNLGEVSVDELKQLAKENHFAAGSMLPKVEASIAFTEATGNVAIIASLEHAKEALAFKTGTIVKPSS
jgi:carbamate kinase